VNRAAAAREKSHELQLQSIRLMQESALLVLDNIRLTTQIVAMLREEKR
jgi:hypothetical protein